MKYTIKTFIKSLVGDSLEFLEEQEGFPIFIVWDGECIEFIADKYPIDVLCFSKSKKNHFVLNLYARNCWYIEIEFSDGGLKRNKKYNVSEILRNDKSNKHKIRKV